MNPLHRKESVDFSSVTTDKAREFVHFHNSYFGAERSVENWLWQYAGYRPDKAIFTGLRNGDELIATQGMMPILMNAGGEIAFSGKSENTLMLPAYRGQGYMEDLYEYAVEICKARGFEFIWGFTSATKAFKRFGFKIARMIQWFERPGLNFKLGVNSYLRSTKPLSSRILETAKYMVRYFTKIRQMTLPEVNAGNNCEIFEGTIRTKEVTEFYQRIREKNPRLISLAYDEDFIKWRIRNHPFLQYRQYQVVEQGRLKAYAFVAEKAGKARIGDLTSEDKLSALMLLNRITRDYSNYVASILIPLNPWDVLAQETIDALRQFSFTPMPPENFVLRSLSKKKQYEDLSNAPNWHINGLWTDGYWV
jgi:GNAT superfamily N-acetyltransferase